MKDFIEDYVVDYINESIENVPVAELIPMFHNGNYTLYKVKSDCEVNGCPLELVKHCFPGLVFDYEPGYSYFVRYNVIMDADSLLEHLKDKENNS